MQNRQAWQSEYKDQYRPQGSQDFRNTLRCTYCEKEGHRQGPACDLWCKHRNERGIPITRFVGNPQDQRGKMPSQQTTQLNAVIVTEPQYLADSDLVDHVACDCSECVAQGIAGDDKDASAMVVTRAAKKKQGPIKWADQEEVRTKVQRRLDKRDSIVPDGNNEYIQDTYEGNMLVRKQVADRNEENTLFQELMHSGVQISLDQLLTLVPGFRDLLFQKIMKMKGLDAVAQPVAGTNVVQVEDVDFKVPAITVKYQNQFIDGVLLDGGSGVNILPESEYMRFGSPKLHPAPFQVKMADQRRLQPLGILKDQEICVVGLKYKLNFVVLRMHIGNLAYPMLLGRPWFRKAKLKQDWGNNMIILK